MSSSVLVVFLSLFSVFFTSELNVINCTILCNCNCNWDLLFKCNFNLLQIRV